MDDAEKYMHRCLQLAAFGSGYVAPNPMVGAIVVCNNKIIGEGYHRRYGEAHAEPNALQTVTDESLLKESTLYVNLEPCSHFGKTPPCANLIISKGIPRVVVGTLDPNPKVSGQGVEMLRNAGIEVVVGILEEACNTLNKHFFTLQSENRPYIFLKWAQTEDGYMDTFRTDVAISSLKISNTITRQLMHKKRGEHQAIMVSTNTALLDNPSLTVRHWTGKDPIRIIIDRLGRIPEDYTIFDQKQNTIIFTSNPKKNNEKTEFISINFNHDVLKQLLTILAAKNIQSVLVEGGSKLLHSFINAGLWDEANIEVSDLKIGSGVLAPVISNSIKEVTTFNKHLWINYVNNHKSFETHI